MSQPSIGERFVNEYALQTDDGIAIAGHRQLVTDFLKKSGNLWGHQIGFEALNSEKPYEMRLMVKDKDGKKGVSGTMIEWDIQSAAGSDDAVMQLNGNSSMLVIPDIALLTPAGMDQKIKDELARRRARDIQDAVDDADAGDYELEPLDSWLDTRTEYDGPNLISPPSEPVQQQSVLDLQRRPVQPLRLNNS